jgi:hypothetical protein
MDNPIEINHSAWYIYHLNSKTTMPGTVYVSLHKSKNHLQTTGTRRVTQSKFHSKDTQILGIAIQGDLVPTICVPQV